VAFLEITYTAQNVFFEVFFTEVICAIFFRLLCIVQIKFCLFTSSLHPDFATPRTHRTHHKLLLRLCISPLHGLNCNRQALVYFFFNNRNRCKTWQAFLKTTGRYSRLRSGWLEGSWVLRHKLRSSPFNRTKPNVKNGYGLSASNQNAAGF